MIQLQARTRQLVEPRILVSLNLKLSPNLSNIYSTWHSKWVNLVFVLFIRISDFYDLNNQLDLLSKIRTLKIR